MLSHYETPKPDGDRSTTTDDRPRRTERPHRFRGRSLPVALVAPLLMAAACRYGEVEGPAALALLLASALFGLLLLLAEAFGGSSGRSG